MIILSKKRGTGYFFWKGCGDVPQSTILFILEIGCLYQYFFENKWGQAPFCKKEDILIQKMGPVPIYFQATFSGTEKRGKKEDRPH